MSLPEISSRSPFIFALRSHLKLDECLLAQQHHHHPGLVEIIHLPNDGTSYPHYKYSPRANNAGQYLTAYKQSEHSLPHADPQARGQDPRCPTHGAHASRNIPSVNKTDVRTLRASFESFAKIAQADARLLIFGLKKSPG